MCKLSNDKPAAYEIPNNQWVKHLSDTSTNIQSFYKGGICCRGSTVLLCLPQCTEGFTEPIILITENLTSFVSPYKSQAFTKGRRGWGQSYYVNIKDKCIPVHEHRIHHIHLKRDLLSKHPAVFQIESV